MGQRQKANMEKMLTYGALIDFGSYGCVSSECQVAYISRGNQC